MIFRNMVALCSAMTLFSGCAQQIASNVYSDACVDETSEAYRGVIVNVRQVRVENSEDNTAGVIAGGVVGGILGNQFGKGSGNTIATATGALLGVAAGAHAEKALSSQDAYEYVVQLCNGEMKVVIQGMDTLLTPGQPVLLIMGYQGRPRIIPEAMY